MDECQCKICLAHRLGNLAPELLEALREMIEATDLDAELPPWVYISIHRGIVGCRYCGGDGKDAKGILHLDYEGEICPVEQALVVIAKAGGK